MSGLLPGFPVRRAYLESTKKHFVVIRWGFALAVIRLWRRFLISVQNATIKISRN